MNIQRSAGILLHPSSLPGKYGIGSLGKEALAFIDFLEKAGQKYWQILPLGPTGYGDSPYQCFSSRAGNPVLIDIELLIQKNWLNETEIPETEFPDDEVDYRKLIPFKNSILKQAFKNYLKNASNDEQMAFHNFCTSQAEWLDDFALFMALKQKFHLNAWNTWEPAYRNREKEAIENARFENHSEIQYQKFLQFLFFTQWSEIKEYANKKGIKIIGDIPIYIAHDSVEAWTQPEIFQMDENRDPIFVSGVPPDYFSATGQLWGNPVYNWDYLRQTQFEWWKKRIRANLGLYDLIRIDHFRGFSEYWAVPAGEKTAIHGKWLPAPGNELFSALLEEFGELPFIAEDLGIITDDVVQLREKFLLPGMKILQFAFDDGEDNEYLPHTFEKNFIVYSGTHDNDTVSSWYKNTNDSNRNYFHQYIGRIPEHPAREFIRLAHASVAQLSVIPMQDILELGNEARMNLPGTTSNNWKWRVLKDQLSNELADEFASFCKLYGR